ncbi:MAG TPA: PEP-CTERM sorting domain-containing protein [Phycisphaerae bacterium]|nr:PEP-CTERM sorting domain-containing protein [Phycisphaerae bacterium]HDZ43375.1 PEP-CTERM sorting domain-containing protein [Phycisphaerae bacterium]
MTAGQGGNVWEWNEAAISTSRGLRGGSFGDSHGDSRFYLLSSYRSGNIPTYEDEYTGLRVGRVPEPATLGLLALGGMAMLRKRPC